MSNSANKIMPSASLIRAETGALVDMDASPHLIKGRWYGVFLVSLFITVLLSIIFSVSIGAVPIPIHEVWAVIVSNITGRTSAPEIALTTNQIIWDFRMPRTLLSLIVGASLAIAGVVMQAVVRNPLADPYILGTVSGASVGAVAVIALGFMAATPSAVTISAFVGAMGSLLLVFVLGQRRSTFSPGRLILAGVAISYLLSAITSYIQLQANPNELRAVLYWLLGSVAGAEWSDLAVAGTVVIVLTGLLVLQARPLNALLMGEESAYALGVDVNRFRLLMLGAASLLTASVVAVSGGVGFVGLMIPHVVRMLVGPDHRRVMLVSVLVGGIFLIWVDILARIVIRPAEMPLGIITGVIGAPFFIYIMHRNERSGGGL
ncbi:MAG: iron ABC transporter permease [Chloroflexota bacterium]